MAKKLIEWALLRSSDSTAGFERYVVFLRANPDWPGALLRRSAEARLWQERRNGTTVRRFVGSEPVSSAGRLVFEVFGLRRLWAETSAPRGPPAHAGGQ